MIRFMTRDVLWVVATAILCAAWAIDHWLLANTLKNCRFALEHQRQTINELSNQSGAP